MSDIKELFDMVTKQTEPDLDSWKEQEERQRRTARRRRIGAFVATAAVVVAGVVAFATLRPGGGTGGPAGSPSQSVTGTTATHWYLNIATGDQTAVSAHMFGANVPEVSPDRDTIAYNFCCTSSDPLYIAGLDGSDPVRITPQGLDGYGATWIDDETILFQGRPSGTQKLGDLYVANVATGELTKVTDLPDESNGAWIVVSDVSPDGKTVLFHLPRGKGDNVTWDLWTAPLAGGEATLLRKNAGFAVYAPDGSIVFLDHPFPFESDAIWIMAGDGSNARPLVEGGAYSWPRVSPDGTRVAYSNAGMAEIVDIATREVTAFDVLAEAPAWYGNDTLIVDDRS
jgi:Tol biopolymer transport system component